MGKAVYRRVLVKLSGEAMMGESDFGINTEALRYLVREIRSVHSLGVQTAVVVGGGNILRGSALTSKVSLINRVTADYMGMLATVINAMALYDAFEHEGTVVRMQAALSMEQLAQPYVRDKANRYLEEGKIVIFSGGTGNPFFTTDTAAALRATEISAQLLLKGTKVDGVYSADPDKDKTAERYSHLDFDQAINRKLGVMDGTALTLCRDNSLPVHVFNIFRENALASIVCGEPLGTRISNDGNTAWAHPGGAAE